MDFTANIAKSVWNYHQGINITCIILRILTSEQASIPFTVPNANLYIDLLIAVAIWITSNTQSRARTELSNNTTT